MAKTKQIVECVPNFSEGRDLNVIRQITDAVESVKGGISSQKSFFVSSIFVVLLIQMQRYALGVSIYVTG